MFIFIILILTGSPLRNVVISTQNNLYLEGGSLASGTASTILRNVKRKDGDCGVARGSKLMTQTLSSLFHFSELLTQLSTFLQSSRFQNQFRFKRPNLVWSELNNLPQQLEFSKQIATSRRNSFPIE